MKRRSLAQHGFSLVELMVALVLGLLLTAGAIYMFNSHRQTYRMADAVARVQENGRFALDVVARDLRMAGHVGCARPGNWRPAAVNIMADALGGLDFPANSVQALDSDNDGEPDTLVIRYAAAEAFDLGSDMSTPGDEVTLETSAGLQTGDTVLIADCTSADIFSVTDVTEDGTLLAHAANDGDGNAANAAPTLSKAYQAGHTEVMRFVTRTYSIDDAGTNVAGDPIRALYRNGQAVLDGVEHMQVQFGECLSGDNRRYRSWSAAPSDPSKVTGVRVGFLLRSIERVRESPDEEIYDVAGAAIGPAGGGSGGATHAPDARLRSVFETTVSLRNRRQEDC